MGNETIKESIDKSFRVAGYAHQLARVELGAELEATLVRLREQRMLSDALHRQYRECPTFSCPPEVSPVRTLIIVGLPSPAVKVRFHLEDGPLEAMVPATYVYSAARDRCLENLRSILCPAGYSVGFATGPVELLALHCALARYGRNNLLYLRGMGVYARLQVFCTDADLGATEHQYQGSFRLSVCPACNNCHHMCPTGCVPLNGTLIDGERCLASINQREGAWPEWLDARAHNSLVGCTRCYATCPANRPFLRLVKVVAEFDRAETEFILQNLPVAKLPPELRAKLAELDLADYSTVLGRNLLALRDAVVAGGKGTGSIR